MKNNNFKIINYVFILVGFVSYIALYIYFGLLIANCLYIILLIFIFAFIIAFKKFSITKSLMIPFIFLLPFFIMNNLYGRYRYKKQFECIEKIQEFEIISKSEFEDYPESHWKHVGVIYLIKTQLSNNDVEKLIDSHCDIKLFSPHFKLTFIPSAIFSDFLFFEKKIISKNDLENGYYLKKEFNLDDLNNADFILEIHSEQSNLLD